MSLPAVQRVAPNKYTSRCRQAGIPNHPSRRLPKHTHRAWAHNRKRIPIQWADKPEGYGHRRSQHHKVRSVVLRPDAAAQ
ncbi:hypothetical protein GCM10010365_44810 [Streptomyces poonensis]|uniref:Uncharacterized protein n=1 Tax=Streptomyces poonensis TaxID=68255 RepID=A0A918ULN8_9ACTN|nr:hypothetical protein GCM10010365_44810 [Streptomyces poonensis]